MTAFPCPDCGRDIINPAVPCPACGCPPEQLRPSGWHAPRSTDGSIDERFSVEADPAPQLPARARFFPVGSAKLALMSVCTFGLYQFFWAYLQWDRVRTDSGDRLSPFWRAFFAPLWNFSLFYRVQRASDALDVPRDWHPMVMGFGYFVLHMALGFGYYLLEGPVPAPHPLQLAVFLSFVPLVVVQQTMNHINATAPSQEGPNTAFSGLNIFAIMFGGVLVLRTILAILFPIAT